MSRKNREIAYSTIFLLVYANLIIWLKKKIAILTKFFPFSFIPESSYLHYKNRDMLQVKDFLFKASLKSGALFNVEYADKDINFIYFEGNFQEKPSLKMMDNFMNILEKKYTKGNIFFKKGENSSIIFVNKKSIISDIS